MYMNECTTKKYIYPRSLGLLGISRSKKHKDPVNIKDQMTDLYSSPNFFCTSILPEYRNKHSWVYISISILEPDSLQVKV